MTREQKLGLIAGFTVVLLFGVLLADHLSRARAEPLLAVDPVDEPLVIPTVDVPARVGSASLPVRPRVTVAEPSWGGSAAPVGEPTGSEVVSEPRVASSFSAPMGASIGSIFERVSSDAVAGPREPVSLPGFVPVERGSGGAAAGLPTTGARAQTHEVKRGETLFQISERYYGNGHLWRRLASHNTGVVGEDGRVAMGAALTIPSKRVVLGEASARESASSAVASSAPNEERTYTVKAGDTLSEISMKLLGTTKRMDELVAMNRDQIRDADDIRVGMKLRYRPGPSA